MRLTFEASQPIGIKREGLGQIVRPSESMVAVPPLGGPALAERFLNVIVASASTMVA